MSESKNREGADRQVAEIVEKLQAVQQACAGQTIQERSRSLQASLAEDLDRLGDKAGERLEALRSYLAGPGGEAARKLEVLASESERLRGEVEALRRERDRLLRDLTVIEPSGASPAAPAGEAGGSL